MNTRCGSPASVSSSWYSSADSWTGRSHTRTSRERTSITTGPARRIRLPRRAVCERRSSAADPGAQLRVGERLLDDVVAAALEHPDPLQPVGVAAQHDQRRVRIGAAGDPLAGADRVEQLERLAR